MLPKPAIEHFPVTLQDDPAIQALATKLDELTGELGSEIVELGYQFLPERIDARALDALGQMLDAGLLDSDSETQKRQKIESAIRRHKSRSSFALDVKLIVDLILGGDSSVISGAGGDDWILTGDGLTPTAFYWGSLGADGLDLELGLALIGEGIEIELPGNIYIDTDVAYLSAQDLQELLLGTADSLPAYMNVFFVLRQLAARWAPDSLSFIAALGGGATSPWSPAWSADQKEFAVRSQGYWCDDAGFIDPADSFTLNKSLWQEG